MTEVIAATPVEEVFENFEENPETFVENVPAVLAADLPDIKLFGRWSCDDVQVSDMSLQVSFQLEFDGWI